MPKPGGRFFFEVGLDGKDGICCDLAVRVMHVSHDRAKDDGC